MRRESAPTARILGPVQLLDGDGAALDLPSASQRRLLAALALHAPDVVRTGWLCEVLDVTPGALRTSVARLRRLAGADVVRTATGGYRLDAEVDAAMACAELERARGDPDALAHALRRWVGAALEEFRDEGWAAGDARRLDEARACGVEDRAEALLAGGDPDRAVQELEAHVLAHPLRDRPCGLLMRALAGAGRQTEALRAYQEHRERLVDTAGVEPGADLREVEQRIASGWRGVDDPTAGGSERQDRTAADPSVALVDDALRTVGPGVGRRAVLERLGGALDRAGAEGAGVVVVSGEAGVGKTTLLADFARGVAGPRGWDVHYGRCEEVAAAPFQPLESIAGRLVDRLSDTAVHAHAARHGGDLVRLLPSHADRIGAPPTATGDDRTARHLLFAAVTDVLLRAVAARPTVLAIDDLQWADPAVVHLLRHLVRDAAGQPVLFLVVARDPGDGLSPHVREALAEWTRGRLDRIDVEGLDRDDLAELVRLRIPDAADRDAGAVAEALRTETAGNGLLADHLLEHWDRSGRLVVGDEAIRVAKAVDFVVPPSLRDLVWHRVTALGDDASSVLSAAAVLGVDVDERVLAATVDIDAASLAPVLDQAIAAGLLVESPSSPHALRFTHALVAQALESDLRPRARRRLHARAFAARRDLHATPVPDDIPRLAHHAERGGLDDEALDWAVQAGEAALDDLAPDEAATWFAHALAQADSLGRSDALRAHLLVRLGEARSQRGDPGALEVIAEGARLAADVEDADTLVEAALAIDRGTLKIGRPAREQLEITERALAASDDDDTATRALLTALVAQRLVRTSRGGERRARAQEALDLARSTGDGPLFAAVAARVLQALWAPGNGPARADLAREAVAAVRDVDDPDLVGVVHFAAYCAAVCAGEPADADAYLTQLHEVAEAVRDPQMRWAVGVLDAFEATMAGAFEDAERIVGETADLGLRIGVSEAMTVVVGQTFTCATFAGRHEEMLPLIEQVLGEGDVELVFRQAHALVCLEIGRPQVAADLVRAAMDGDVELAADDFMGSTELLAFAVLALELEDVEAAAWLHPQVVPLAGEVSFNSMTSHGPISAYAGKLASLLGRTAEAEGFLRDALATAEAFGWTYHRASTLLALAQNRVRASGTLDDESSAWLAESERLCAAHGFPVWGRRAVALRERTSG